MRRGFPDWRLAGAACDWLTLTSCPHPLPDSDAVRGKKGTPEDSQQEVCREISPLSYDSRGKRPLLSWPRVDWADIPLQPSNSSQPDTQSTQHCIYSLQLDSGLIKIRLLSRLRRQWRRQPQQLFWGEWIGHRSNQTNNSVFTNLT